MSSGMFSFGRRHQLPLGSGNTQIVQTEKVLRRVLSFTGKTIDDVVNDPIAKRMVLGFYKLNRWVDREVEIGELERQWTTPRSRLRGGA